MGSDLFFAINCDVIATNTEFSNAGGSVLTLVGGKYYFAHCTMANYMSLTKREMASETVPLDSKCLYLLNNVTVDGNGPYPITQAYFDNCTIDGSYDVELKADGSTDFDYRFNHCALKAKESSSDSIDVWIGRHIYHLTGMSLDNKLTFALPSDTNGSTGTSFCP